MPKVISNILRFFSKNSNICKTKRPIFQTNMSFSNTCQIKSQLLPDNDLQRQQFLNTYLQKLPRASFYDISDFTTFSQIKFGGILVQNLPGFFRNFVVKYTKNENLCNYWDSIYQKCEFSIILRVLPLYKYKKLIEPLDGYTNMKEYLTRALDRNMFIWNQLVLICMDNAAKRVSGPEANAKSAIKMMNIENLSHLQQKQILEFVENVRYSLEGIKWLKNVEEYVDTTGVLLELIKQILPRPEPLPIMY